MADCQPRPSAQAPLHIGLVSRSRLWPALRQSAASTHDGGVDLPQLMRQLARAHTPVRLPRCQRSTWAGSLWVLQDVSVRLAPYQRDFDAVVDELLRLRGADGMTLWRFTDLPSQVHARETAREARSWATDLPRPAPGTRVLVLSDMGALAPGPAIERAWEPQLRQWRHAGADVRAWLPARPAQVPAALASLAGLHCLAGRAGARRQLGAWATPAQRQAEHQRLAQLAEQLMVLASCAVHLSPALLRALRHLDTGLRAEPALEAVFWTSAQVQTSRLSRALAPGHAPRYRQRLTERPAAMQGQVLSTLQSHHAVHGRSTGAVESLLWHAHAAAVASQTPQALSALAEALQWFQAFDATALSDLALAAPAHGFAADLLQRQQADARGWSSHSGALAPLWALSGQAELPPGLDANLALAAKGRQRVGVNSPMWHRFLIVQRGLCAWLWPEPLALPRGASVMFGVASASAVVVQLANGQRHYVPLNSQPVMLTRLADDVLPVVLTLDDMVVTLEKVVRPAWAQEWARHRDGLYALGPKIGGTVVSQRDGVQDRFDQVQAGGTGPDHPFGLYYRYGPHDSMVVWSSDSVYAAKRTTLQWGLDAEHGISADLTIRGVEQRFRWLPPGEFWIGSPDDEHDRRGNEGPRHRVCLSQGLWLADTACTQALWLAVMGGKNPSHFADNPLNPVTRVSWDDVQAFLAKLQPLLPPGCVAVLPTEAEWEYACRAGTSTPFSFGNDITPEQVNYDCNFPYRDGDKAQYRNHPVPVKSLPANDWGLYEMHGNVWEWCADGARGIREPSSYPKLGVDAWRVDPFQPPKQGPKARRVLRGGSWLGHAHRVRSASRYAYERGYHFDDFGFRLALRSSSTSTSNSSVTSAPEAPPGQGPGRDGPAAPVGAPRRDAGAGTGSLDPFKRLFGEPAGSPGKKSKPPKKPR